MQINRFALGIRFDFLSSSSTEETARRVFDELFSVLTVSDLEGLALYGGIDTTFASPEEAVFLAVIMGGKFKAMRQIYEKIEDDAAIGMYLVHANPFIENNRLIHVEGLAYYGEVQKDGTLKGGDCLLEGPVVPKQRGRHRPVGKGIKILLAPDSFKGTFSSTEVIKRLTIAARRHFLGVKIVPVPIADGGEGTVKALVTAAEGAYRRAAVRGPLGDRAEATYGVLYGKTAVIEMAEASGLTLVEENGRDVMRASSFGTGELIRRALDEGIKDIVIGLGGSATNDCGMGLARALGVKFFDGAGNELAGCGADLGKVERMDLEYLHPRTREASFTVMCDVNNPLLGGDGATRVYGKQKGATDGQLDELEAGMESFAAVLEGAVGVEVRSVPGAGAAGGAGAMLMALLGAKLVRGIDAMLNAIDFDKLLKGVALVVTGEGRLDAQSVEYGKAISGIVERCTARRIPVAVITGGMTADATKLCAAGNVSVMTAINAPMTADMAIGDAERLLDDAADRMFRFIRMGRDVEKIGAPKKPRQKSYYKMLKESLARKR